MDHTFILSCADPESFFRGGTTFFTFFFSFLFLVDEGREDPNQHYKWAIIGPPEKHHLNGVVWRFAGGQMVAQH